MTPSNYLRKTEYSWWANCPKLCMEWQFKHKNGEQLPAAFFTPAALLNFISSEIYLDWKSFGMFLPNVLVESYYYTSQTREEVAKSFLIGFYIFIMHTLEMVQQKHLAQNKWKKANQLTRHTDQLQIEEDENDYVIVENKKYFQLFDIQWCRSSLTKLKVTFLLKDLEKESRYSSRNMLWKGEFGICCMVSVLIGFKSEHVFLKGLKVFE